MLSDSHLSWCEGDKFCPHIFSPLLVCIQVVTQTSFFFEKSSGHSLGYQAKFEFLRVELSPTPPILQPLWAWPLLSFHSGGIGLHWSAPVLLPGAPHSSDNQAGERTRDPLIVSHLVPFACAVYTPPSHSSQALPSDALLTLHLFLVLDFQSIVPSYLLPSLLSEALSVTFL